MRRTSSVRNAEKSLMLGRMDAYTVAFFIILSCKVQRIQREFDDTSDGMMKMSTATTAAAGLLPVTDWVRIG